MLALRRALPGALLTFTLLACSDSTAPRAPEHLPMASGDVARMAAQVDSVFEQPILVALRGNGTLIPAAARASIMLAGTTPAPHAALQGDLHGDLRDALLSGRSAIARDLTQGAPVVPTLLRGVTFVWNGSQYVVDTLANGTPKPGAPVNGVRFMVYPRNPSTRLPEGAALGHLDVVDNSSTSATHWTSSVVTNDGLVVLQATNSVSGGSDASFAVSQSGFITDGTRRIEQGFSLGASGLHATWNAPFAGLALDFRVERTGLESAAVTWMVTTPHGALKVAVSENADGSGSAQIVVNGAAWARQSWAGGDDVSDAAWQKADGSGPIAEADAATMVEMLGFLGALSSLQDFELRIWELLGAVAAR